MASKNARIKRKACTGKIRYLNSASAQQAAIVSSRKYKGRLGFYKCQFCKTFHVGHTPAFVIQKINERRGV